MSATQTLATERDIVAALQGMHEVDGVRACEFILTYDDKFDEWVANARHGPEYVLPLTCQKFLNVVRRQDGKFVTVDPIDISTP